MWFLNRKNIGLALGGGGAKGLAHIGVLKVLEEKGYKIKYIAGTSSGALIGGLYAFYKDAKKVEEIVLEQDIKSVVRAFSDIDIRKGVVKGGKVKELIESYIGEVNIEDLDIKFATVTVDIVTGEKVAINTGLLSDAIVASGSLPYLFQPKKRDDALLIDGGLVEPVPVRTLKEMGCKRILAVDLITGQMAGKNLKVISRSTSIMFKQLIKEQCKDAWKIIVPEFEGEVPLLKVLNGKDLIDLGEAEARKVLG